jgi:hypothetical protein
VVSESKKKCKVKSEIGILICEVLGASGVKKKRRA